MNEELSYGRIFGQSDCSIVGVAGFDSLPQSLEEMSANRPVWLISGNCVPIDAIQNCQSGLRSLGLSYRRGMRSLPAEGRCDSIELFIELRDRGPLDPAASGSLGVDGLNGGFELKAS